MNGLRPIRIDEGSSNLQAVKTEYALRELRGVIRYALARCLSPREVIDRICCIDKADDSIDHIRLLEEFKLTESDFQYLVDSMEGLAAGSEKTSSRLKARIDRTLLRLVRLLPSELAIQFAEPFINHRRKGNRARQPYSFTETPTVRAKVSQCRGCGAR